MDQLYPIHPTWEKSARCSVVLVQVVHKIIYIDLSDFSEFITAVQKLGFAHSRSKALERGTAP